MKGDNRTMDANQFEYIRSLMSDDGGETLLARKFDNGQIYTVKLVRKLSHKAVRLVARMRNEQAALKLLTKLEVAFVMRLWWSFEDERAMYLVTVSIRVLLSAYTMLIKVLGNNLGSDRWQRAENRDRTRRALERTHCIAVCRRTGTVSFFVTVICLMGTLM